MVARSAIASLAAALVLWSVTFPVVRAMLGDVPVVVLTTLRFTLASILLGIYWLLHRPPLPKGRDFWLAALSGFFCVTLYQILSTYGIRTVTSGPASVLVDSMPLFATLFSVFVLSHRPKWRTWTGMGISLLGIAVIALGESHGALEINLGTGMLLSAALLFSLGTIAQKPIMKRNHPLGVTTVSFAAGALGMLPFNNNLLAGVQSLGSTHLASIAFLAAGPGALAYALWGHALSRLPVSKATASLFLIGPLTFFIAWAFFGEHPALLSIFGAAVTLGGVLLVHSDPVHE